VIIGGEDDAKKRTWKERHSASCRVENDCERDWQQQATAIIQPSHIVYNPLTTSAHFLTEPVRPT